jgi:glutamine amidotransferase PdxT
MSSGAKKKVGVLALQGDFEAHGKALERAGAEPVEVRSAGDLQQLDGLVIPGGESTTMLKLLEVENLMEPLREFGRRRPIFGTCAGAILLANEVLNPSQASLGLMDICVERKAYGRQIENSITQDIGLMLSLTGSHSRSRDPPQWWAHLVGALAVAERGRVDATQCGPRANASGCGACAHHGGPS